MHWHQGSSRSRTSVSWPIPAGEGGAARTDADAEWGSTGDVTHGGATQRVRAQAPGMRRGNSMCARLESAGPYNSSSARSHFLLNTPYVDRLQTDGNFTATLRLAPAVSTEVCPDA